MKVVSILRYPLTAGGRINKKLGAETIRKRAVVTEEYVEKINAGTDINGLFCKVNSKATEQYEKECLARNKELEEANELKSSLAQSNLAKMLGIEKKQPAPKKAAAAPQKKEDKKEGEDKK